MILHSNLNEDTLIDKNFLELRRLVRKHGKYVMSKLFDDFITGPITKKLVPSCIICGTEENLTREHVLPRWVFQNNPDYSFTLNVNKLSKDFIKATVPACARCNSELLNGIERYIQKTLASVDFGPRRDYSQHVRENIARWLEIIDYKFQFWEVASKFVRHKNTPYVPDLADFSVAFMKEFSVRVVTSKTRLALKRIGIKNKSERTFSLFVANTAEKDFHYFHTSGEFIYIQEPTYNKLFFYFFEKKHRSNKAAIKEALKIINYAYNSSKFD